MQLRLSLGDIPVLPSKRAARRLRRRVSFFLTTTWSRRIIVSIAVFLLLIVSILKLSPSQTSAKSDVFATCFQAPVQQLISFDPFVLAKKATGAIENEFENRFQEDVWDTIMNRDVFPAWSDMRWNIPQYSRALGPDLMKLQQLALKSTTTYETSTLSTRAEGGDLRIMHFSTHGALMMHYVHHRLDRLRGLQYVAHFTVQSRDENHGSNGDSNKPELLQRSRAFTLAVQMGIGEGKCSVWMDERQSEEVVYIIVPYTQREERLHAFLLNFAALRREGENMILIVCVLRGSRDVEEVQRMKRKVFGDEEGGSEDGRAVWMHENDGDGDGGFSRGVALREGARLVSGDNAVVFHCDVDMIVKRGFSQRCRHNSRLGSQVYYPVFYSLFPYGNGRPGVRERNGFWRKTSFGMACMRKGDFESVGAYDEAEGQFHGWGSEDVFQFERIRNRSSLVAFRAVDPGLLHKWHSKECDGRSKDYEDCMKTNFVTMGHPLKIGPVLLKWLRDVPRFFADLQSQTR